MKNDEAKHNTLCKIVSYHLQQRGWKTITHVDYTGYRNGEIDVLAFKEDYVLDIEVKCKLTAKNKRKAIDQLDRAYRFCPYFDNQKIFTMIAHEHKGKIQYEWVKQYEH